MRYVAEVHHDFQEWELNITAWSDASPPEFRGFVFCDSLYGLGPEDDPRGVADARLAGAGQARLADWTWGDGAWLARVR
jgi:hypothetical protein